MNDLILIALSTFSRESREPLALLEASGIPFEIHKSGKRITREELLNQAGHASVIVAGVEPYDADLFKQLPALRCISRCGVGVDSIDLVAAREHGVTVANTPDSPVQAVAELALSMFLSLSRNIPRQSKLMSERRWERVESHLLRGQTVGLIGFGRIGRRVAELCLAFGAKVHVCDPFVSVEEISSRGVVPVSFDELLATSDILSIHASKGGSGSPLLGNDELARVKPGAIVINLARGDMIDEDALVDALRTGRVSGAGLDVFPSEPYTGALCDFPQVILTPHSATLPVETRGEMECRCVQNALDFISGDLDPHFRVC